MIKRNFARNSKKTKAQGDRPLVSMGIELPGGTPYDYKLRTVTYYFKPVK